MYKQNHTRYFTTFICYFNPNSFIQIIFVFEVTSFVNNMIFLSTYMLKEILLFTIEMTSKVKMIMYETVWIIEFIHVEILILVYLKNRINPFLAFYNMV